MSLLWPTTRAKSSASCTGRVAQRTWRRRSSTHYRCAPPAPSSSPTRLPSSSLTDALRDCVSSARSRQQATLDVMPRCQTEDCFAATHDEAYISAMEGSVMTADNTTTRHYLELLNTIASGERRAGIFLQAWADTTPDPALRACLSMGVRVATAQKVALSRPVLWTARSVPTHHQSQGKIKTIACTKVAHCCSWPLDGAFS